MNKDPRFIDFQSTRNFLYQNSRTYNERVNKDILTIYHSTDQTSISNQLINLEVPLTIDATSEILLESIQITTMDHDRQNGANGSNIKASTIGFIINIDEFNIKSSSNISLIRDKIFVPYSDYTVNNANTDHGASLGINKFYQSSPMKNNYLCTINPTKLKNITLSVNRLQSSSISGGNATSPTSEDIFQNSQMLLQ